MKLKENLIVWTIGLVCTACTIAVLTTSGLIDGLLPPTQQEKESFQRLMILADKACKEEDERKSVFSARYNNGQLTFTCGFNVIDI